MGEERGEERGRGEWERRGERRVGEKREKEEKGGNRRGRGEGMEEEGGGENGKEIAGSNIILDPKILGCSILQKCYCRRKFSLHRFIGLMCAVAV